MTIALQIRQLVRKRANYLCEYCHSSEEASAARFDIDHIFPRSLGGSDELSSRIIISTSSPCLKGKFSRLRRI